LLEDDIYIRLNYINWRIMF